MIELPNVERIGASDLSLDSIDQSRATLEALIVRCQATIAEASRVLAQLDTEREKLATLLPQQRDARSEI
jgi:hypothetical protein